MASTPSDVSAAIAAWRAAGCPRQSGIPWDRSNWLTHFPAYEAILRGLPGTLDRATVRAAAAKAADGGIDTIAAFLAIMARGFGAIGYGPYRTGEFLANPGAAERLAGIAGSVVQQGPLAAYRQLSGDLALPGLGVAFGTKFLYFCPRRPDGPGALILDRFVAKWLGEHTTLRINSVPWNAARYHAYLETMHGWANAEGIAADQLEECIFVDQVSREPKRKSQWVRR